MKQAYLIQRLKAPATGKWADVANTFAFGGGMKNGGLSDEAMKLLSGIFSFDYMGSAEFEFGEVPKAFQKIAKAKLVTGIYTNAQKPIYWLCSDQISAEIEDWIKKEIARKNGHTKEHVGLREALNGDEYADTKGWLELDNPFMLFIDQQMWENTCKLFGIEVTANQ